ncbi:MAG: 2-oxoglutarate dehydrogenase complex dihydrolipoyllysine-residue succinyltransferase [Puniceicoccaceae bacterium]
MQHEVKIPSLGESIVSGILTQWNCKDGDTVQKGDMLYELETDKITSEGTAEISGVIELLVEADSEVKIGQVVARITESEESKSDASAEDKPTSKPSTPSQGTDTQAEDSEDSSSAKKDDSEKPSDERYPPSVERIAASSGIDPSTVKGTGKAGRVTKADMLKAQEAQEQSTDAEKTEAAPQQESDASPAATSTNTTDTAPAQRAATATTGSEARSTRKRMSPIRRKIAERLVSVKNEAAILTTFNEVDMSAVMQLRKQMQEEFVAAHGVKLGFMSFFVKAAVSALKAVPGINAQIDGDEVVTHHYYDIGVAVGTERGLVVPVLRGCDALGFAEVEQQLAEYAQRAKQGKINIEDMQGGVFTISNGGVYGSLLSTPIINPPQSGILGMHSIQERPVAINGEVKIRPMMYLALSYDHRIVDGKEAVTFLIHIKKAIENPSRLLFGI